MEGRVHSESDDDIAIAYKYLGNHLKEKDVEVGEVQ